MRQMIKRFVDECQKPLEYAVSGLNVNCPSSLPR